MTHRTFVISDTHFGHRNILVMTRRDGTKLRPFATIEEMDETIIERWNKTVRPVDKIYHLGDFAMSAKSLVTILQRLNGHKRLIRGNHDIYRLKQYLIGFEEVYGVRALSQFGIILSHIPIHPDSLDDRWGVNVHGHLHANAIDDPRYVCVSVEHTHYAPVDLENIVSKVFTTAP